MSTGTTLPRALLTDLLDDAAVFPPGSAPLPRAVAEYRDRVRHPWADLVGPLLVPATASAELLAVLAPEPPPGQQAGEGPTARLPVVLVARPDTPVSALVEAVARLWPVPTVRLAGVELSHQAGWQQALDWGVPVAVEVDRAPEARQPALAAVAAAAAAEDSPPVRIKLRTQSSPAGPVPTGEQVAGFLTDAHAAGLPAKLTGGLHHAVATTVPADGGTEDQHGLLNVLLAAERVRSGAPAEQVLAVLAERHGETLAGQAAGLTGDRARAARTLLTAVGCCGVLDPLTELADLGLLPAVETARQEDP
ncbi:hypothetical protein [Ornithinicoccus halotolerans]|uniref:hypothetical protein n=1 Tax=Ornithinicoccus halotolerans TaxID=1748220 RepID=UPI001297D7BC|nr:hypothetical protein [Ornithinicoccus halotolerans]